MTRSQKIWSENPGTMTPSSPPTAVRTLIGRFSESVSLSFRGHAALASFIEHADVNLAKMWRR
jgi:hypothetical protein